MPKALPILATRAGDDGVGVRQVVVEHNDGRLPIQHRPVGHRKGDVLVVVQDGDFEDLPLGGHDVSPGRAVACLTSREFQQNGVDDTRGLPVEPVRRSFLDEPVIQL
jgi:hypothetical protein